MSVQVPVYGEQTGPGEIGRRRGRPSLAGDVPAGEGRYGFVPGVVPELLVGTAAAAVYGWGVWAPSPWRDEAATMAICRRSLDQILAVTENVDLVHLAFYLLAHVAVTVHDSVTSVRLISVVAMAIAAALVVRVGRRAGDAGTGALAGCLIAVSPLASRWAQDARPFALVTLVAVLSTLVLLRAVERPSFARWIVYGLSLILLCLLNVLGLLLLSAHGTFLLLVRRRALLPWLGAAVAVAGISAPFLSAAFSQRGQVSWITPPAPSDLTSLFILTLGSPAGLAAVGAAGLLLLGGLAAGRLRLPDGPRWVLLALGCAWGVVPASVLWGVSLVKPLWDLHYVIFSVPGVALAVAAAVRLATGVVAGRPAPDGVSPGALRRLRVAVAVALAAVPVAATAVVSLPTHLAHRDPESGHDEDMRGVATYLGQQAKPGDAVLFLPGKTRIIATIHPHLTGGLTDVALGVGPVENASINGTEVDPEELDTRLPGHRRIFLVRATYTKNLVRSATDGEKLELSDRGYRLTGRQEFTAYAVELYLRDGR